MTPQFRAGDTVKHRPSGETWILSCDQDRNDVMPAGWPESKERASDCELVEAATDEQRLKMLTDAAKLNSMRGDMARRQLQPSPPQPTSAETRRCIHGSLFPCAQCKANRQWNECATKLKITDAEFEREYAQPAASVSEPREQWRPRWHLGWDSDRNEPELTIHRFWIGWLFVKILVPSQARRDGQ